MNKPSLCRHVLTYTKAHSDTTDGYYRSHVLYVNVQRPQHNTQYSHTSRNAFEVESEWPCSLPRKRQADWWRLQLCRVTMLSLDRGQFRTDPYRPTVRRLKQTVMLASNLHYLWKEKRFKSENLNFPRKNVAAA